MRPTLLLTALVGTAVAVDKAPPTTAKGCASNKSVTDLRKTSSSPIDYCEFITANRAFALKAFNNKYVTDWLEPSCVCVKKFEKKYGKSTKKIQKPPAANATEQIKAMKYLDGFLTNSFNWCKAWEKLPEPRNMTMDSRINATAVTENCAKVLHPPTTNLTAEDAAAANLFTNPTFSGNGTYGFTSDKTPFILPGWNASVGIVTVQKDIGVFMYTYGPGRENTTIYQTLSNLAAGSSYHIYMDENWSCMRMAENLPYDHAKVCRWDVLVDGKSVWNRITKDAVYGPDKYYPVRYKDLGPVTFNATQADHKISFRASRLNGDGLSTQWVLKEVYLTGPW
ncbi:hypothetical protein BDZ85DRAFT_45016 [Elsinoe ampelina]|uniref:Uncharacterized protein n=1 Tax=Elsinoe ampelina TaxID=302913 RepID=A0A6A6G1A1_9PEZI|nr:hypothetical protein BDZ85DRAFT_45016 [Elsinoe ampelina]